MGNQSGGGDSSAVAGQLKSGVKVIYSSSFAFSAVKRWVSHYLGSQSSGEIRVGC